MKNQEQETITYEEAMNRLEEILRRMDQGELPLEEAITAFQQGLEYIKICQGKLTEAEGKLHIFRNGQFEEKQSGND